MDGDSLSAKRRHSRPLELDSEGEEEMDTSEKEEEEESDREEEPGEKKDIDRLSSVKVRPEKVHTRLQVKKIQKLIFFINGSAHLAGE